MTKKRLALVMSVLALITILSVAAVGVALAQTTTPPAQSTPTTPKVEKPWGRGFGFGFRGGNTADFDAVAKTLNLTPTQLFEQLHSGKTLSEIAEAQGVDLQAVQEAQRASRVQAMKDKIAQAVTAGTITQEQADWLLQGLDKGWAFGGRGMGFGFDGHGRGGMRGMRGLPFWNKGGPQPAPSTSAQGTSS